MNFHLQDFTIEHDRPEVVAQAVIYAANLGAPLNGLFICRTRPFLNPDEYPSHTLATFRQYRDQPVIQPELPFSGFIASIGYCNCLNKGESDLQFASVEDLSRSVEQMLREADTDQFVREFGAKGPFRGTDGVVTLGYRLHYNSWRGSGLWLSFRHFYLGK